MNKTAETPRQDLFRYLTASESAEYVAIMELFSATLLVDLSPAEVAQAVSDTGTDLTVQIAEARCRQLVEWGNLTPAPRDARVNTVADFWRARSRFQISKLGGRTHRAVMEVLQAAEGAREVARELLGQIVNSLDRIAQALDQPEQAHPDAVAGMVTSVFNDHQLFSDSARDFYAYLSGVLSRFDLVDEEYTQFKRLLLDYVDLINADVNRHAPAIAARLTDLQARLDDLLNILNKVRGLDIEAVDRGRGRSRSDWEELAIWYGADGSGSGADQLRAAAGVALGQLISNAKRMLDTSGVGYSRRADLLRLARWFDTAETDDAHRLFAAAFIAYPARHLALGPEEPDPRIGPTTSFWTAPAVDVPVSLRERADRAIRGRSSRVPDPAADRRALAQQAEREAEERRSAAVELSAAGRLHGSRLSPAARDLLLDRLSWMWSQHLDEAVDDELGLVIRAREGADTVVHSEDGDVTVEGFALTAAALAPTQENPAATRENAVS
ncbi:TIGR02677 family protein [Nakamurella alba]|uniref:TIGR02677 family protein n=1 Tax=Nakamurella alba TaxID=2665158 RepID=UPI0012B9FE9B|nr:TIGR02677 family protein [Nakamurella alba]